MATTSRDRELRGARSAQGPPRAAMTPAIFPDQAALAALCRQHRIRRLALFGSRGSGTSRPDSDVDLLVEFEPGAEPGLLALAQIEMDLSALAGGLSIDLRTRGDLSRHFRDEVSCTAELQYEA